MFMHLNFAHESSAKIKVKSTPQEVLLIDSQIINLELITHEVIVELIVGDYHEILVADITNKDYYHCILSTSWLVRDGLSFSGPKRRCSLNPPIVNRLIYCR